ncbi:MAG TPA: tail fiber domain-containing protein [Bacteroidales bacterium]|jgi:acetyltransferase-like isoleucine patch superfamily enzyme|nr:tail fiber domain-containing protein [Bacteroidales bacterium]
MKKLILILFLINSFAGMAQVAINTDNSDADNSAMLDVKSTTKGLLIPRMTTAQRDAIAGPANGLLIFQTDGAPGFYYNSGSAVTPSWTLIGTGTWTVAGNSGTNPATNFLGTTDNVALKFRVSNTHAGIIDPVADNTSLGKQSLNSITTGTYNSAMGGMALGSNQAGQFNSAFGYSSAYLNENGSGNVSMGAYTLCNNTAGNNNTAIGLRALFANTTGNSNLALGQRALYSNTDRSYLVAVGDSALYFNGTNVSQPTHAIENTAVGSKSLYSNTNGFSNTAFGYQSLYKNNTGYQNTAIGVKSLYSNTSGIANMASGAYALYSNSSGVYNTAAGYKALYSNDNGAYNTAVGDSCMLGNTSGSSNTAMGVNALKSNLIGGNNVAIGYRALYSLNNFTNTAVGSYASEITTGDQNTSVGYAAGSVYTFTQGTFLGAGAYPTANGFNNCMALGYNARVDASNKIVIGNTSVASIGGYAGWSNFSDGRFKKNVSANVPGLAFINELKPVTYTLDIKSLNDDLEKNDIKPSQIGSNHAQRLNENPGISEKEKIVYSGFIAQDVEAAARHLGYDFSGVDAPKDSNGRYGLRYGDFVVPLVKAVQELSKENEDMELTIKMLKERVTRLENSVK